MAVLGDYRIGEGLGLSSVVARVKRETEEDEVFINESLSDVLKRSTFIALMAIPGFVDAKNIDNALGEGSGGEMVVDVTSPNVQRKVYDAIGKDNYLDFVVINIIARTLMAEAIGENSKSAFDAVASVIWNRAGGDRDKFVDVIWAPRQFSCWNSMTDLDKKEFVLKPHGAALTNPSAWKYCVNLARRMVNGEFTPTGKWKQYYAHNKVTPPWANKMVRDKKVFKNHTFGNF